MRGNAFSGPEPGKIESSLHPELVSRPQETVVYVNEWEIM